MQWTRRVILLAAGSCVRAQSDKRPDFSGRWVMNEQASELGNKMREGRYRETLIIDHREPIVRIDYLLEFNGDYTRTLYVLKTYGMTQYTQTPLGEEVSSTSWQGDRMVTDSVLDGRQESRTTRYLSADGKRLYAAYGKSPTPKWLVFDRR